MNTLEDLQLRIRDHCTEGKVETGVPGLLLYHSPMAASVPIQGIFTPMLCVIAQGSKQVSLAGEVFAYDAGSYLLSSVDLPVSAVVRGATPERPYLALSLALDLQLVSFVLAELPRAPFSGAVSRGLVVSRVTPALLDSLVRLVHLLDCPEEIAHVAPLIQREIVYRLLTGECAAMLRQTVETESRTQQVMRAIQWIRQNYARQFRMEEVLRTTGMSAPSLHRHFKAMTAMSPLQYQKQIRLQEARRMLVTQGLAAADAGYQVGYESPSQFSREYCRYFGAPPREDARRLMSGEGVGFDAPVSE